MQVASGNHANFAIIRSSIGDRVRRIEFEELDISEVHATRFESPLSLNLVPFQVHTTLI